LRPSEPIYDEAFRRSTLSANLAQLGCNAPANGCRISGMGQTAKNSLGELLAITNGGP